MRHITVDSVTFWQVFNKMDDFILALTKDGGKVIEVNDAKGYLKDIPVYIKNNI